MVRSGSGAEPDRKKKRKKNGLRTTQRVIKTTPVIRGPFSLVKGATLPDNTGLRLSDYVPDLLPVLLEPGGREGTGWFDFCAFVPRRGDDSLHQLFSDAFPAQRRIDKRMIQDLDVILVLWKRCFG